MDRPESNTYESILAFCRRKLEEKGVEVNDWGREELREWVAELGPYPEGRAAELDLVLSAPWLLEVDVPDQIVHRAILDEPLTPGFLILCALDEALTAELAHDLGLEPEED